MPHRSLIEYLDNYYRHGRDIAYVTPRGYRTIRWSYRETVETVCQFAGELEARKIGAGDRVLLWGGNSAEWVVTFLGCLVRGAVVVPMDSIATNDFALRVARQVGAKLLVCSRERTLPDSALPAIALENLREVVEHHARDPFALPDLARDAVAQIVFTSGTTAEPKGVAISHGNILANLEPLETEIEKYVKYERFFHPLRFLNLLPLSHVFGQFLGIFVPPLLGATVVFQDSLKPSEVIRTIRRERVSVLVTVPRVLETLRNKIERDFEAAANAERFRQDFAAAEGEHFLKRWWRFRKVHRQFGWKFWAMISGGAALPIETETFWNRLGYSVIQGYGLTETTSLVSVNHPFRLGKGSIGKVLPGREIKLDPSGEILVRGENIASGYWESTEVKPMPVAGEAAEGWFRTGDIGAVDSEGNLYFKGRKKNVIVTPSGMNIYPEDLEAALRRQPEVRDAMVMGLECNGNAEPCAVLLLQDPEGDGGAVVKRANESLAEYQRMHRWLVWPEQDFPRTSTGKPRASVIAEAVRAQTRVPGGVAPARSELSDLIARITGQTPSLRTDANLATDLNLNSLDRVELLSAIEDRYQIELNETTFATATTVGELECLLRQTSIRHSDYIYPRWAQRWPTTWIRPAVYYLLAWPATLLLGYPWVKGRTNLRGVPTPVLVISNHITFLDAALILAALPPRLCHRLAIAMEGERLQLMRRPPKEWNIMRRWLNQLGYALAVALFNVFPLPQQSGFRESFQYAGESVDRGYSILVFPEGARSRDGRLAPFRAGIGLLVKNLNLPVVPMCIDGLFELKRAGKKTARPGQIEITIGAPVEFAPDADPQAIAQALEACVLQLSHGSAPRSASASQE